MSPPLTNLLPPIFSRYLQLIEPGAEFSWSSPSISSSSGLRYFAKFGSSSERDQYIGEAESLKALYAAAPGLVPKLIVSGLVGSDGEESLSGDGDPYFLSEYKDMGSLSNQSATVLGRRLATEVHAFKSTSGFGFAVPTFCGATRLENGWYSSWEECYDALIEGLLSQLKRRGSFSALCTKGEQVRKRAIPALLRPLVIHPVLLHGDLWSGNTGTDTKTGEPVIFDPSSMFGHNEFDLAIGRMFGGIPSTFITEYHKHLPKSSPEDQYNLRGDLYELFHYLNHTRLFGSSYAASAEQKMDRLLRAFP